jgi:UDP-N-acetylmuramoylalanine--D-glutamate ligase
MNMRREQYKKIFNGKKITQMGLGVLGRGKGDADFLARYGAELLVTDLKSEADLVTSVEALKHYPNVAFRLQEHREEDFRDRDLILKGPGVPKGTSYIREARQSGVPVDMSASLFARIAQIPMVGVTGTRGKSTVTHLVHDILKADEKKVLLGGNVKGVSNLALLEEVSTDTLGVFELDSWQCQGFGEEKSLGAEGVRQGVLSPQVAVFTTFMPDHQNYYKGDMDLYLRDKANIFLHQNPEDTLIVGAQALSALTPYKKHIRAHVEVVDETYIPKGWQVPLLGVHNRYNVALALAVARTLGVDDEISKEVIEHLKPIAGRLEFLREYNGVRIYNDTNATTPDATIAALTALDTEDRKNVVLIAGGADKELDVSRLVPAIEAHAKQCVLLDGTGTKKMLEQYTFSTPTQVVASLQEAFESAMLCASKGDSVVLSPAFASFGMFKNEYDRGEQFTRFVANLK